MRGGVRLCMDSSKGLYKLCVGCLHGAHFHCLTTAVHVQTGLNLESVTLDLSIKMIC